MKNGGIHADVTILKVDHISPFHNLERTTNSEKISFYNRHLDTQHGLKFFSKSGCNIITLVDILVIRTLYK